MNVKNILKDLYKLDPSLKNREPELLEIIEKFVLAKPDTKFDKKFENELKKEILGRFAQTDQGVSFWQAIMGNISKRKFAYAMSGVVILIIIAAPLAYFGMKNNGAENLEFGFNQHVKSVGENAFGQLSFLTTAAQDSATLGMGNASAKAESAIAPEENGVSADDRSYSSVAAPVTVGGYGGGGASASMPNPMPYDRDVTGFRLKYIGENLSLTDEKVTVLKREKNGEMATKFGSLFRNVNAGILNLSKFKNLEAQNVSLVENRDNGYNVYFDIGNEIITLNKNWNKWPVSVYSDMSCSGNGKEMNCGSSVPSIKEEDVPRDEVLISIADNFIKEYGINKNIYGAPEVDKVWQRYYLLAKSQNDAAASVPQNMTVTYPLILNGKQVYEQYGGKIGLKINIDIKDKKVTDVNGLETQNYSSSEYVAETDSASIVKFAEEGGANRIYSYPEAKNIVTMELETPQAVYVRQWKYNGNESSELFVPSFLFKIKEIPSGVNYYNDYITVPLVKEMLQQNDNMGGMGVKNMVVPQQAAPPR